LVLASLFIACAGDEPREPALARSDVPPGAAVSTAGPEENEDVVRPIDVTGIVTTDRDEPLVGRSVVLVDARGARHERFADADGTFSAKGILPPYDVVVGSSSSGPAIVHLGLRRSNPWLELFERSAPTPSLPSQTIRVGVRGAACDVPSCTVMVMTASASGFGSTTSACEHGNMAVVDVEHRWHALAVSSGEQIDLHVLVADGARSSFAYARIEGAPAAPGDLVDAGVVEPAPVPATDPIWVGVVDGAALTDWRWSTSVFLDFSGDPDGASTGFLFATAHEASMTVRAPLIPRSRMFASVVARHPRADEQGGFHRSGEVWSGARSLSVDPVQLEIAAGPEVVRPGASGALSRRGLGFAWRPSAAAALSTMTVADTTRGNVRFRVLTTGNEVPLAQLARLGLPKLELGDHMLDLSSAPGVGADDAVSPDAAVRRKRSDRTRAGRATYLRVPFQVTN